MYRIFALFALIVPTYSWNRDILVGFGKAMQISNVTERLRRFPDSEPDSKCWKHVKDYIKGVKEMEDWAMSMFDSMEKIPYGILAGRLTYMGNFDECLSANATEFKGKHCMLEAAFPKSEDQKQFLQMFYGICLPSSCNGSDIEKAIELLEISQYVNVTVDDDNCWTDDPIKLSPGDWAAIAFLAFFGVVAVCSTIYDLKYQEDKGSRHELYSSFSFNKNLKQLFNIYNGQGNIGCLHGIRTLTMCWIVLGHEYIMPLHAPCLNGAKILKFIASKEEILVTNAFVSVDTFFLLSGLLVTLVFFRDVSKKGSYDVPVAMIHRYIRITPAYAVMVFLQSTLVLRLGRGPMWNRSVGSGVKMCKKHWWQGLLYLQNLLAPNSSCLGQSWYLSSDMQMFWLSPLLLYPLLLWPRAGLVLYFVYLAAALISNFVVSFVYELGPHMFLTTSPRQFEIDYVQTHMRLVPYIVGMGLAYIICGIKANKIRVNLSKKWQIIGWLTSAGLCLGSIYSIAYFLDNLLEAKQVESSSYLTFHRLGWSLGLAWVIFACCAGYGGLINQFLSWDGFQVLGKLSYCMFLVHFTIQICRTGLLRTDYYIDNFEIVTSYFSSLVLALMFSVPLYLLFEVPFGNIDRYFSRKMKILPYPRKVQDKNAIQ